MDDEIFTKCTIRDESLQESEEDKMKIKHLASNGLMLTFNNIEKADGRPPSPASSEYLSQLKEHEARLHELEKKTKQDNLELGEFKDENKKLLEEIQFLNHNLLERDQYENKIIVDLKLSNEELKKRLDEFESSQQNAFSVETLNESLLEHRKKYSEMETNLGKITKELKIALDENGQCSGNFNYNCYLFFKKTCRNSKATNKLDNL
jgi:uncharacterized coiled-coil protein SlyX